MVKKTRRTYLLRTIKKNGVSSFAVALIAATSIAIYLGIQSGAQAILEHAGRNFEENRLATWEITCANGITGEDMDALAAEPEADTVEGGYRTTAFVDTSEEKITVQIRSLLKEMNHPTVLDGKLPTAENEVAVEQKYTLRETKTFVSKDNIFLIALGLIVGCGVGTPLAQFEVMIMETGNRRYITTPSILACFLSVVICVIFALIINAIALRKINHLSLTNVSGN